jgi:hypothetical protein
VALAGDYNLVPTDLDIYPTKSWDHDALLQPQSRAAYRCLLEQGWTEAVRALHPKEPMYTFWDYMRNGWDFCRGASSAPRPGRLRALLQCAAGAPGLKPAPDEICSRRRLEAMAGDGLVWKVIPTGKSAIQPDGL